MKNFFYKNVRLKNDQSKIVLRILPEAEERCKLLFLDTAQNHGNNLFLVLFASATLLLVLYTCNFVLKYFCPLLYHYLAGQGKGKIKSVF